MKRYANAFAIVFGGTCAGLAVVSAWKIEAVHPLALAVAGGVAALAALINPSKFYT